MAAEKKLPFEPVTEKDPDGLPNDTINENFTARPKDQGLIDEDVFEAGLEFDDMNEDDARESGYTDAEGHAVSMAKPTPKGRPTGAYTDIGAGRSSAVVPREKGMDRSDP